MSGTGAGPGWFFNAQRQQYYYYDARTDQFVFQDGSREARPPHVPRTAFPPQASAGPSHFTASPPQQPAGYQYGLGAGPSHARSPTIAPHASHPRQQIDELAAQFSGLQSGSPALPPRPRAVPPHVQNWQGIRVVTATNPETQVQTRFGTAPAERFTDPALLQKGIRAHRTLYGTEGSEEHLYPTFKIRQDRERFFRVGRVFLVLWTEPAGETKTTITSTVKSELVLAQSRGQAQQDPGYSVGRYGERVYSKVRRFVVIRPGALFCSALPIATYGKKGVGKSGVKKSDHAIIYTGRQCPPPMPEEMPSRSEQGMQPTPIRVTPDDPTDSLDPMSRLDFAKVHTIHHNIKVKPLGMVHPNSEAALTRQFGMVWGLLSPSAPTAGPTSAAGAPDSGDDDDDSDEHSDAGSAESEGATPQRRDLPTPLTSPAAAVTSPRAQAHNAQVQQSQNVRSALDQEMQRGSTREEAMEALVQRTMQNRPQLNRESALALLNARLSFGRRTSGIVHDQESEASSTGESGESTDESDDEEENEHDHES